MPVSGLKRIPIVMVFSFLLASAGSCAELLQTTQYHGDEVKSKSGLTWLGLFPTAKGEFELNPAKVEISLVHDPVEDRQNVKTGKLISVSSKRQPLFLVRGVSGLKSGKVSTSLEDKEYTEQLHARHLLCGKTLELKLGSRATKLTALGSAETRDKSGAPEGELLKGYELVLECGGVKQTLYKENEITLDGCPSIIWAGDLDRDGKLDLFIDMTNHYNLSKPTLFLSSKAKLGKLVEAVASISAVGC